LAQDGGFGVGLAVEKPLAGLGRHRCQPQRYQRQHQNQPHQPAAYCGHEAAEDFEQRGQRRQHHDRVHEKDMGRQPRDRRHAFIVPASGQCRERHAVAVAYDRRVPQTLTDADVAALQRWVREQQIGSEITDLTPLAGGTQNIVVGLRVDGRRMVLRRPPEHPRPTSNKTMLREIAALQTLAGSDVPHPEFICGCEDLDVLGVVFYLMAHVDGFNPGNEVAPAYVQQPVFRHDVGIDYARSLARLGQVPWEGRPLEALKRPGPFLERQVPQFRGFVQTYRQQENYAHDSLPGVDELADWLDDHRPPDSAPGVMHGDAHLNNVMLRYDRPEVAAFVDWEMCTVGDPLVDLGWMLVCWPVEATAL